MENIITWERHNHVEFCFFNITSLFVDLTLGDQESWRVITKDIIGHCQTEAMGNASGEFCIAHVLCDDHCIIVRFDVKSENFDAPIKFPDNLTNFVSHTIIFLWGKAARCHTICAFSIYVVRGDGGLCWWAYRRAIKCVFWIVLGSIFRSRVLEKPSLKGTEYLVERIIWLHRLPLIPK